MVAPHAHKVYQTEFGPGGNCYAACLATILQLDLSEVPDFRGEDWDLRAEDWLHQRGYTCCFTAGRHESLKECRNRPRGWSILGHQVLNGHIHSAVFLDGKLFHDPSPRPFCREDVKVVLWTAIQR